LSDQFSAVEGGRVRHFLRSTTWPDDASVTTVQGVAAAVSRTPKPGCNQWPGL
jgi:hypothetical protein